MLAVEPAEVSVEVCEDEAPLWADVGVERAVWASPLYEVELVSDV